MRDVTDVYKKFGISDAIMDFLREAEADLSERFSNFEQVEEYNKIKVIDAMQKCRVSAECMLDSSGYGYQDVGRDTLERVYAECFRAEAALVRAQISCGTHALTLALRSNLRPGDELISPAGGPYDTLEEVIGVRPATGSLSEYGISYRQVELKADGGFDYEGIRAAIGERTRMAAIQRSMGYQNRPSFSVERIGELIAFLKSLRPDIICMVDNCYGEFTECTEPTEVGADMIVGSLIKNPGGGLAPMGGYIAGTGKCVENAAAGLTSPGLGREVGASIGVNRAFFQGLFQSPGVVCAALKSAALAAMIYERLGFRVRPGWRDERMDIIQSIELGSKEAMEIFAEGIQSAAPVDAHVRPCASDMPGYDDDVIMAAGSFISGSSIELSADGPVRPPYAMYFQGGLDYAHGRLGVLKSAQCLIDAGLAKL